MTINDVLLYPGGTKAFDAYLRARLLHCFKMTTTVPNYDLRQHLQAAATEMINDFSGCCFGSPAGTLYKRTQCLCIKKWLEEENKETIVERLVLTFLEFSMTAAQQKKKKQHHRRLVEAMRGFKYPYITIPSLNDFEMDEEDYNALNEPTGQWFVCQNAMLSFVVRLPENLKQKAIAFRNISTSCMDLEEGYRFRAQGRLFYRAATQQRTAEWENEHVEGKELGCYFKWNKVRRIMQQWHSEMINAPTEQEKPIEQNSDDDSSNNHATIVSNAGTQFSGKSNMSQKSEKETLDFVVNEMTNEKMSQYYKNRHFHHIIPLHEFAVLHNVNPVRETTNMNILSPKQLMDLCKGELLTLNDDERDFCTIWGTLIPGGGMSGSYVRTARNSAAHNVVYSVLGGTNLLSALLSQESPPKLRKLSAVKQMVTLLTGMDEKIRTVTERVMIKNGYKPDEVKDAKIQYRTSHVVTKNHTPQSPHRDYVAYDKKIICYNLWLSLSEDGLVLQLFPQPGIGHMANVLFGQIMVLPDTVPYSGGLSFDDKGHICVHMHVMPFTTCLYEDKTQEMDTQEYIHHPQLAPAEFKFRYPDSYKGYSGPKIAKKIRGTGTKIKYHLGTTFFGNNFDSKGIQKTPAHKENTQRRNEIVTMVHLGKTPREAIRLVTNSYVKPPSDIRILLNKLIAEGEPVNSEPPIGVVAKSPSTRANVASVQPNMWEVEAQTQQTQTTGKRLSSRDTDQQNVAEPLEGQKKKKATLNTKN